MRNSPAELVRKILIAANCSVHDSAGETLEPRVVDLDIGVVAGDRLDVLTRAGYTFRWHPDQYELNRGPYLFGVRVAGS